MIPRRKRTTWLPGWLLPVLALTFVYTASGLGHLTADVLHLQHAVCDDGCGTEEGNDCTPGCASCTCGHAAAPAVPAVSCMVGPVNLAALRLAAPEFGAPASPEPRAPFRPPRAHA